MDKETRVKLEKRMQSLVRQEFLIEETPYKYRVAYRMEDLPEFVLTHTNPLLNHDGSISLIIPMDSQNENENRTD